MRRAFAVLVAVMVGGCGGDRLKPGDEVLVTASPGVNSVMIETRPKDGDMKATYAEVAIGTKARVIDDKEADSDRPGGRLVRIQVLENKETGTPGRISRGYLSNPL